MYAWKITEDRVTEGMDDLSSRVGWTGPRGLTDEQEAWLDVQATPPAQLPEGIERHTFRMFDDDGELYYRGIAIMDDTDAEEELSGPLIDLGRPDAGCCLIEWDGHPTWACEA